MGKISHNETSEQNATTSIFTLRKDIRDTGGPYKGASICGVMDSLKIYTSCVLCAIGKPLAHFASQLLRRKWASTLCGTFAEFYFVTSPGNMRQCWSQLHSPFVIKDKLKADQEIAIFSVTRILSTVQTVSPVANASWLYSVQQSVQSGSSCVHFSFVIPLVY